MNMSMVIFCSEYNPEFFLSQKPAMKIFPAILMKQKELDQLLF